MKYKIKNLKKSSFERIERTQYRLKQHVQKRKIQVDELFLSHKNCWNRYFHLKNIWRLIMNIGATRNTPKA